MQRVKMQSLGHTLQRDTDRLCLGLIVDRQFHEDNKWCCAATFHLVEELKRCFNCIYIQSQSDYEKKLGYLDLLISMEPGWAAPVLQLTRTPAVCEQLSGIPWNRVKTLLEYACNHVPFYRKRFDQIGLSPNDIRSMEDFRKIPVLRKADIQRHLDEMKAANYPVSRHIRDATGRSPGQSLVFFRNPEAQVWTMEAAKRSISDYFERFHSAKRSQSGLPAQQLKIDLQKWCAEHSDFY